MPVNAFNNGSRASFSRQLKVGIKGLVAHSSIALNILNLVAGGFPKVFMYHRFAPSGVRRYRCLSADEFGWQLDRIADRFTVITLGECLDHFARHGEWPTNTVILTIDDGYRDFYTCAYPELVKRGLRATFFVTVNFVDRKCWLWPDRIEYALWRSHLKELPVEMNGKAHVFRLDDDRHRAAAWQMLSDHCITLDDEMKHRFIDGVISSLAVELPKTPPHEYGAVSWGELRDMHSYGIEIGSHTLNHPILSKIPQVRLHDEIGSARDIIQGRIQAEVKTFCYPNSRPGDVTVGVIEAVKCHGYRGAVFGTDLTAWDPYLVPRMGGDGSRSDFLWKLYGGEALSLRRGERR
ncbi:polysaccharide deacetylase family protein [Geobacter pickeringii]|uniref:NodB homology domain-containing protein n=1 Tax=Geobacter pickeringii TaxID=345632 RepID=A0A0B5BG31_9BACT|nr:polysaccharide deacetylase family protein [Geobacter pickeringii]AJE03475.1 hypothetical protein GPICK_09035 [Geobacter pickeringii]